MPLLRNQPFVRLPFPDDLKGDEFVFYCELTSEVFLNYDDFFNRTILLNSMVWTCNATGKSGLTYEEAIASEKAHGKKKQRSSYSGQENKNDQNFRDKKKSSLPKDSTGFSPAETLPKSVEKAAATLMPSTARGTMADLTNDLFEFLKEYYAVGETVEFFCEGKKRIGVIVRIEYKLAKDQKFVSGIDEKIIDEHKKHVRYTIEIKDKKKKKVGPVSPVVHHGAIQKRYGTVSKARIKNFIKIHCEIFDRTTYKLKDSSYSALLSSSPGNDAAVFGNVFGRNCRVPVFESTPLARKSTNSGCGTTGTGSVPPAKELTPVDSQAAAALNRRRIMVQSLEAEMVRLGLQPPNSDSSSITDQEKADRLIQDLKDQIKAAREAEKERVKEEKKRLTDWKKQRDDLDCDDHKPLPEFSTIFLHSDVSPEEFGDFLSLLEFVHQFYRDEGGEEEDFVAAVAADHDAEQLSFFKCDAQFGDTDDDSSSATSFLAELHENFYHKLTSRQLNVDQNAFLRLLRWFLAAVFEKAAEEDAEDDEEETASLESDAKESNAPNEDADSQHSTNQNSDDFYNQKFAYQSKQIFESVKKAFGVSVKALILNQRTLSELLRLYLLTCGHYGQSQASVKDRMQNRGGYKARDNFGFILRIRRPDIVEKLTYGSVLDFNFNDRLQILLALRDQLLTFNSFRAPLALRLDLLHNLRQELRQWSTFEQRWDKDAKTAKCILELDAKKKEDNEQKEIEKEKIDETPPIYVLMKKFVDGGPDKYEKLKLALWEGLEFSQLTNAEQVDEIRRIQKEFLTKEIPDLKRRIKRLRGRCGLISLGRDRAYRNYWLISSLNCILVEHCSPDDFCNDLNSKCQLEPTPLTKTDFTAAQLLVCTGRRTAEDPPCPLHDFTKVHSWTRWRLVASDDLNRLMENLNGRGFREVELLDNLKFYHEFLTTKEETAIGRDSNLFYCKEEREETNKQDPGLDWDRCKIVVEMRARLLELEEGLHARNLSFCNKYDREEWKATLNKVDATSVPECSADEVDPCLISMTSALERLTADFNIKYFTKKSPFYIGSRKKNAESPIFDQWRCCLRSDVKNWSRLFLCVDTLENSIAWQKCAPKPTPKVEEPKEQSRKSSLESDVADFVPAETPFVQEMKERAPSSCNKVVGARKRVRCSSSSSNENDSADEEKIKSQCRTRNSRDNIELANKTATISRTGRPVKKPISFEDLMSASKKNVAANKALIEAESSATSSASPAISACTTASRSSTRNGMHSGGSKLSNSWSDSPASKRPKKIDVDQLKKCQTILRLATHFPDAWPFLKPVNKEDAPDYYEVIAKPMDLHTLRENLDKKDRYKTFDDFYADLKLIFDNCRLYNEVHAPVYKCGEKLERYVNQKIRELKF